MMRGWMRVAVLSAAFVLSLGAGTGLLFAMRGEDKAARQTTTQETTHDAAAGASPAVASCAPGDPCSSYLELTSDAAKCESEGGCADPSGRGGGGCTPEECGVCTPEGVCSSPAMPAPSCAADVPIEKCYPDARPAGPLECIPAPDGAPTACAAPCVIEGVPMPVEPAPLPTDPSTSLPPQGSTSPGLPVSPDRGGGSSSSVGAIACPPPCDPAEGTPCGPIPCPQNPDASPCGGCIEPIVPSEPAPDAPRTMPCWIGCDTSAGAPESVPCPPPPCGPVTMLPPPTVPNDRPAPAPQPLPCPAPCAEPPVKPSTGTEITPCPPPVDGGSGSSGGGSAPSSTAVAEPGTVTR